MAGSIVAGFGITAWAVVNSGAPADLTPTEHRPMILNLLTIFAGSMLASCAVAYAIWSGARATFLRQDLFTIRDRLWDEARKRGRFDDPAYLSARKHINGLIRFAETISVPVVEALEGVSTEFRRERPKSSDGEFQCVINKANVDCSEAVIRYVLFGTATGVKRLLFEVCRMFRDRSFRRVRAKMEALASWLTSTVPEAISKLDDALAAKSARSH